MCVHTCVYIYIYIYIYIYRCVGEKHSSGEEQPWEEKPSECQISGWRAVSASGLQGRGSPKRSVSFADAGIIPQPRAPADLCTPNLPTMIAWLKLARKFPMDLGIPPLKIKILPESSPLKSRILVRRLAVGWARPICVARTVTYVVRLFLVSQGLGGAQSYCYWALQGLFTLSTLRLSRGWVREDQNLRMRIGCNSGSLTRAYSDVEGIMILLLLLLIIIIIT